MNKTIPLKIKPNIRPFVAFSRYRHPAKSGGPRHRKTAARLVHYGLTGSGFPPSLQKRLINLVGDHQRIQVPNDISYCTLFSPVLGEGIPLGRPYIQLM